ncbi:MAG: Ig-like domain-containing protein, partial [Sulfobacillus sp.]
MPRYFHIGGIYTRHRYSWGRPLLILAAALTLSMPITGLAHAEEPTVSSLTVSMSGSPTHGSTLTFTGQAVDWNGSPQYQYWMENSSGWHMVQNYSPDPSWSMTAQAGSYVIATYAMNAGQIKAGYWNDAVESTTIVNVESAVSLTAPPTATEGNAFTVTASATNLIDPVYQFWIESPNGRWQGMPYGASATDTFNPPVPGTYQVVVYAKDPDALANPSDSVWSQTATVTVAPAIPPVANIVAMVTNPLPGFRTSDAVLLGEDATLSAVVTNPEGAPLADVPVVFTATNDSNPGDHVTFGEGLSGTAITNQNGVAQTTLAVTNPEDGTHQQLAVDSNALAIVGYSVSIPSDPALAPVDHSVRFVALSPSALSVNGAVVTPGVTQGSTSQPIALTVASDYLVPTAATTTPYTMGVNYQSGSYSPNTEWSSTAHTLPYIAVDMPFAAATLNLQHLGLSTGSTLTVQYVPNGSSTAVYSRTFTGPMDNNGFGVQIPSEGPGNIAFSLSAPGETNPATATGLAITSVSVVPTGMPGTELRPVTDGTVWWQNVPLQYTGLTSLSSSQASTLLGAFYNSQWTYWSQVPVYPEVGDALITAKMYGTTQATYAFPISSNFMGQNV